MNDTLASLIKTFAPTVASSLLGPFAGFAITGLSKLLGVSTEKVADLTKVITEGKLTPEQLVAIQSMEAEFKEHEAQRGVTYAELEFKDRDSARARQIAVKDDINQNLAYLIILAFIIMVACTLFGYTKAESVIAGTLIGYLSAKAEQVLAYYFGSSRGSDKKSDLLAQSAAVPAVKKEGS